MLKIPCEEKNTWIGAMYYNIVKTQFKGKNYYTLFGFDNNTRPEQP